MELLAVDVQVTLLRFSRSRVLWSVSLVVAILTSACGRAVDVPSASPSATQWDGRTLAAAVLPPTAFPPPFTVTPDSQGEGGSFDLARMEGSSPPGNVRDALARDGFIVGYRRNWSGPTPSVGYVELAAFRSDADAADYKSVLVAFFAQSAGASSPAADVGPDATTFTVGGPGGAGYTVLATRHGVVVQVVGGGASASLALVKRLAIQQLSLL